jgi:selenide,water dikinase
VRIEIDPDALPTLPGALEVAAAGVRTGGDRRNREFAGPHVTSTASAELETLAYDPQTSGGLLVTLPADRRVVLEAAFAAAGVEARAVGRVESGSGVRLSGS